MLIHHHQLLFPLFLSLLLPITTLADSKTTPYQPKDHILINFGLSKSSTQPGNQWRSDEDFVLVPPPAATTTSMGVNAPYDVARIFRTPVNYSIPVTSWGPKFVRLYLYPPPSTLYNIIDTRNSSLSLTINGFEILRNCSSYLVAANADAKSNTTTPVRSGLVREIYVTVNEGDGYKALNLTFSPGNSYEYGFINGIEIISVPDGLYVNRTSAETIHLLEGSIDDYINTIFNFPSSLAMENVVRLNVGGGIVVDPEILRNWYNDQTFVVTFDDHKSFTLYNASKNIHYTESRPPLAPYTAPVPVYASMREVGPYFKNLKTKWNLNLTWEFEVDSGFNYLVRLHFCELNEKITQNQQRQFYIYINNQKASNEFDVFDLAGGRGIPIYRDFVTFVYNTSSGSRVLLPVSLLPDVNGVNDDALLNGLEIFKLNSSDGSLAAPNPALPKSLIQAQTPGKKSRHLLPIIGGILGAILVSLSTFACFVIIYRRKKTKQKLMNTTSIEDSRKLKWVLPFDESGSTATTASVASKLPSDLCRYFSLAQIKVATCNFDDNLIIGTGGFGKVYKGSIDGGATTVAIKRLNSTSKQGAREFQTEIEMLSRLRHVHLLPLIGYSEDQGEMILVYEYMPRGALRDHLLYKNPQKNNTPLAWKQRLMICVGSARGLHYLHAGAKQLIIHRDVKSTNILLDNKWTAKVSDFGLSKVGPDPGGSGPTHISTAVKGSAGYLDPEYYQSHQLTEKSDVYSFGVVLFEVLCARAAVNPNLPREQANLAMWARSHYRKETLQTIVDPNLTGQIAPESLRKFGEIADMCVRERGSERPSMGDVVWGLEFALQLQETAENNIIGSGTLDESFDLSSNTFFGLNNIDEFTASRDNFTESSVASKLLLNISRSTTSISSD